MKKHKNTIIFFLVILLLIISGNFIYRWFDSGKEFTSKEDIIKDFEKNYLLFEKVREKIVDQDGFFYAEYIDNKLVIETNIQSINSLDIASKQEFEKDISFIIDELKYIGVFKDEKTNLVVFAKEENGGGIDIIYSPNGNDLRTGIKELIKQNWYYYIWQGV